MTDTNSQGNANLDALEKGQKVAFRQKQHVADDPCLIPNKSPKCLTCLQKGFGNEDLTFVVGPTEMPCQTHQQGPV